MNEAASKNFASPRALVLAGAATFGIVAWWAMRDASAPADVARRQAAESVASSTDQNAPWTAAAASASSTRDADAVTSLAADQADVDVDFASYVDGKYKYLMRSPGLSAALMRRERLAVRVNTAKQDADESRDLPRFQAELAEADRKVRELLAPRDVAGFEVLKDSDMDQFQFEDYVGGIGNIAPLADEKKQAVLYAKLANRQRFREVLENSGLMRGDLTPSQRRDAFADVSRALRESRDGFLQEARQHMHDEEQFTLLSNYENTEYGGELDKLRRVADGE